MANTTKQLRFVLELTKICNHPVENVYVSPSLDNVLIWNGVLFPPSGYYKGGVFRFNMVFSEQYPTDAYPKIYFETDIFHPLVDPASKELNLRAEFDKNQNNTKSVHIVDFIQYVRNVLIDDVKYWHNSLFIFNRECFRLYLDYLSTKQSDKHLFILNIKQCVQSSVQNKDKAVNASSNALILTDSADEDDEDDDQTMDNGHTRIIRENLKTFKSFKDINGLIQKLDAATKVCMKEINDIFDPLISKLSNKKHELMKNLNTIHKLKTAGLRAQSSTLTDQLMKAEETHKCMRELIKKPISLQELPKRQEVLTSACNFHSFIKFNAEPCTRWHVNVISNNLHRVHQHIDSLARISCAPTPEILRVSHDTDDGEIFITYKLQRTRKKKESLHVRWTNQDEHTQTNKNQAASKQATEMTSSDDAEKEHTVEVPLLDNDHDGDNVFQTSFKVTKTGTYKVSLIYIDSPASSHKTVSVDRIDDSLQHLIIRRKEHKIIDANKWHKYHKVIVHEYGELTTSPYNRHGQSKRKGGKLYIEAKTIEIRSHGKIHCNGKGYKGGQPNKRDVSGTAYQGDSFCGAGATRQGANKGGGGGGLGQGGLLVSGSTGGGGGGYGTKGNNADRHVFKDFLDGGRGGETYGDEMLSTLHLGSGGGAGYGYKYRDGMPGGCGGGAIMLIAEEIVIEKNAAIEVNGEDGASPDEQWMCVSGGGAGSGGSIHMVGIVSVKNKGTISAKGGNGGEVGQGFASKGGDGGSGRIRIDCNDIQNEGEIVPGIGYTKYHFYEF